MRPAIYARAFYTRAMAHTHGCTHTIYGLSPHSVGMLRLLRLRSQTSPGARPQTSMFSITLVLSTRFMMPARTLPGPSS